MYVIALLATVCILFNSCSTRIEEGNKCHIKTLDSLKFYKVSSFKSWLLLDSKDSRYAPLRLSAATLHPNRRHSYDLKLRSTSGTWSNSYISTGEPWPIATSPPIVLKPANYNKDINIFIEQLNLQKLAQICYNGQQGRIYYVIGERKAFPFYSPIVVGNTLNIPIPYIPAYFATNTSLDLSVLMDNIWFLYQLSTNNLIEPYTFKGKKKWKWSKLSYKLDCNKEEKITSLPNNLKKRFAILEHIQRPKGIKTLPAISYKSCATNEALFIEINELRAGEGYVYCENAHCQLAIKKHQSSWNALLKQHPHYSSYIQKKFKGNELWLSTTNRQNFIDIDSAFKKERAISQYELFVFPVEIYKYYQNKRKIELIFDSN